MTSPGRLLLRLGAAALLLLAQASHAAAGDKVDRALRQAVRAGTATEAVIISLNPGCRASKKGDRLLTLNGTSMSAAIATGVVALALEAHNQNGFHRQRAITPNLMKALVEFSAIRLAHADALSQGTGEVNAAGSSRTAN